MRLPESSEQLLVGNQSRIEEHDNDLSMSGLPTAHVLVAWIGSESARITGGGAINAFELPKQALSAPKTA